MKEPYVLLLRWSLNTRLFFILYLQLLPGAGLVSLSP